MLEIAGKRRLTWGETGRGLSGGWQSATQSVERLPAGSDQFGVDHFLELFERLRARQRAAVDEEVGRAIHADRLAGLAVDVDRRGLGTAVQALRELAGVHAQVL